MSAATHDDVVRLFPGIQDHAVLEVLATNATVNELDVALRMLQGDDEDLIGVKQREGSRLGLLLEILDKSEVQVRDDLDR